MRKSAFFAFFGGLALIGSLACNQPAPSVAPLPPPPKPDHVAPFRYHKLLEVSPGQEYDIFSWGRGSATTGSFLILHSDSAAKKFTTTSGDLNGSIVDVYNSDMDLDGNPEILIHARGTDSTNYATIYAFEFTGGKADKLNFPKLSTSQQKGYRGEDNFYIKEGKFIREFPIYSGTGKDAKNTGAKRIIEYGLRDNAFTVKQLSKDSVDKSQPQVQPVAVKKKTDIANKPATKHSPVKKHKKKKHHRNSDDN